MMRLLIVGALVLAAESVLASDIGFEHLVVDGATVSTTNGVPLSLRAPDDYLVIGPYNFYKNVDDLRFEVTLVAFVTKDVAVSIAAERLDQDEGVLDYTNLPEATWPDSTYRQLSGTCMPFSRALAEQLPEETGVKWLLEAGFDPDGHFAVSSSIKSGDDGLNEVSIEIVARTPSCENAEEAAASQDAVRSLLGIGGIK